MDKGGNLRDKVGLIVTSDLTMTKPQSTCFVKAPEAQLALILPQKGLAKLYGQGNVQETECELITSNQIFCR